MSASEIPPGYNCAVIQVPEGWEGSVTIQFTKDGAAQVEQPRRLPPNSPAPEGAEA